MADANPVDDARHKREQEKLRAKRKAAALNKSKEQLEKERKRKEHIKATLARQNAGKPGSKSPGKLPISNKDASKDKSPSVFQALFEKRAEGFLIELKFRNTPPRPPVGPTFIGRGIEGALQDWASYKPGNSVETNYIWKLHSEPDLGVNLGTFAMDWKGCYRVPKRAKLLQEYQEKNRLKKPANAVTDEEDTGNNPKKSMPEGLELHPDDHELLHWTGGMGDSAAEEVKVRRERARAMATLESQGLDASAVQQTTRNASDKNTIKLKKQDGGFTSRVLKEDLQFFMKKTTYLTNDQYRSVHQFKSLAETKRETEVQVAKHLEQLKKEALDPRNIEKTFAVAKQDASRLKHPSKPGVTAVASYPFLPDVGTWGYTFTHVVLDEAPKPATDRPTPDVKALSHSFVAEIEAEETSKSHKMTCKLLVPDDTSLKNPKSEDNDSDDEEQELLSNDAKKYEVVQQYDLDVIPLKREDDEVHSTFVLVWDNAQKIVTYHPVSSRVALSTGRPGRRGPTYLSRRPLDKDDKDE